MTDDKIVVTEFTLTFAFRYALGRMSTAPSIVADDIKRNWHLLDESNKERIKEEIQEAIEEGQAGMECDVAVWREILEME